MRSSSVQWKGHGSAISPLLYVFVMDATTRGHEKLLPAGDPVCADDLMLACDDKLDLYRQVQIWCDRMLMFELTLVLKKFEYLTTDEKSRSTKVNCTELSRTSVFRSAWGQK